MGDGHPRLNGLNSSRQGAVNIEPHHHPFAPIRLESTLSRHSRSRNGLMVTARGTGVPFAFDVKRLGVF
jgi:hypothetical protein